jgi:phosphoglycerol transferase MdoB-like AlkP superfamily enzyme
MFFNKLQDLLASYRRLLLVVVVLIFIQVFEIILLNFKYDLFTGGFLQPFSYQSIGERLSFFIISVWYDLTLIGLLASLWFFVADKLNKYGQRIYYSFSVIVIFLAALWLLVKFKLLSYFNDTVNLQIIKNLAGGSLKEALLYASNEIALFIGLLSIAAIVVVCVFKALSKIKFIQHVSTNNVAHKTYRKLLIATLIATPLFTWYISQDAFLRYGLEKKMSFRFISTSLDRLSDIDFDGFGSFAYPQDKAIFDAFIYPGAVDIPGNGIDEDGFLGDAIVQPVEKDTLSEITPKTGKHIFLIVLESARAELIDKKLNGQQVAPVMKGIAQRGVAINYAYSHAGYTVPSIKAIFNRSLVADNSKVTLIQFLRSAGYQLSIISGQDESFGGISTDTGMKQLGISYFDARTAIDDRVFSSKEPGSLRLSEARIVEHFNSRINQVDLTQPQFFYINIQAGHFPYAYPNMPKRLVSELIPRSEITAKNKDWLSATYWNAMANADWTIGKILEPLINRRLLNNITLVILGDHGESLFDDGFLGHGHAIDDTQTKIPLFINDSTLVITEPIGQIDVAELTIRSALGLNKQWLNNKKTVFQWVGSITQPTLIAHVAQNGVRTLFDFRTEQVFFSDLKLWKSYQLALQTSPYKERLTDLIRAWEDLNWQQHKASKGL